MEASPLRHQADLTFARQAASGAVEPWQEFVLRYSALILRTVRRYMMGFDVDDHRAVYVGVLAQLHGGDLNRYDGSVTLSSWVMLITRSRSLDAVRTHHGRKRSPSWLRRFSTFDREVYRLFFVEASDVATTRDELRRQGYAVGSAEVHESLDRLDARIDARLRRQLAYELYARSVGGVTARLLACADSLRQRAEDAQEWSAPDAFLVEEETRAMVARLRADIDRLPSDERGAIQLRFWGGLRADAIAARMGLGAPSQVQRLIRRAILRLRRILVTDGVVGANAAGAGVTLPTCPETDAGSDFPGTSPRSRGSGTTRRG